MPYKVKGITTIDDQAQETKDQSQFTNIRSPNMPVPYEMMSAQLSDLTKNHSHETSEAEK